MKKSGGCRINHVMNDVTNDGANWNRVTQIEDCSEEQLAGVIQQCYTGKKS